MKNPSKLKTRKLAEEIQEMNFLGLWLPNISTPDPQILERILRLNEAISERLYELHLPETNGQETLDQIKNNYYRESIQKRKERKKQLEITKKKKSLEWIKYKANNFPHLGKGISKWLNDDKEDLNKLKSFDLRNISSATELSEFLNVSIQQIKWLAYHRKTSKVYHYQDFSIAKSNGQKRYISKPRPRLHYVQNIIKKQILDKLHWNEVIFGFIKGKSIYNHATYHRNPFLIINVDIRNFFHSINYYQVRSAFNKLGYSGQISTVLALLTTKQDVKMISLNDNNYFVFSDYRFLPQGACTSPGLSNLISTKIDKQLITRSRKLGFKYSRYVDDLTFSTTNLNSKIKALLYTVKKTLELHGFEANSSKTQVIGKNNCQNITGLVVNSGQPKIPRIWRRKLRAAIHQFPAITDVEHKQNEYVRILGSIEFLKLSHPQHAKKYIHKLNEKM